MFDWLRKKHGCIYIDADGNIFHESKEARIPSNHTASVFWDSDRPNKKDFVAGLEWEMRGKTFNILKAHSKKHKGLPKLPSLEKEAEKKATELGAKRMITLTIINEGIMKQHGWEKQHWFRPRSAFGLWPLTRGYAPFKKRLKPK